MLIRYYLDKGKEEKLVFIRKNIFKINRNTVCHLCHAKSTWSFQVHHLISNTQNIAMNWFYDCCFAISTQSFVRRGVISSWVCTV